MPGPTISSSATALGVSHSDSHIHSGWTAGAGVEVMFAPKWSVKAEYLYRSFASQNYFTGVFPAPAYASGTLNLNSVQRRRELSLLGLALPLLAEAQTPPFPERRRFYVLLVLPTAAKSCQLLQNTSPQTIR